MTNLTLVVSLMLSTPQLMCGESDLGRCVRDSLFNEVVRLDRAADAAWTACDTQENLASLRAEDAAIAARHFSSMLGGESVALVAHKEAAIPAAHAYFLERGLFSSFATISPPPSWHETVRSPTAASSFANTVFGALKAYDWTDLANRRPEGPAEREAREREELSWLCREWHAAPERIWPAHPSAAKYPGVPEAGTPRVTREIDVDLSIPRWHGTGLFEAAGEPITVTLPEGAEKLGLRVRVGTTHCNITSHKKWSRAPVTTVEIPLKKRKTVFSNPFGGMVYVTVPYGKKGAVKVKIGPACPAARYVDGRDNLETWAESLKTCPAPMAEIESDVIALTVPREDALKAKDPQTVLDIWRKIMENDARLTGIPAKRQSPERMCFDVQLCSGYMHSGYPIMIPKHSAKYLLNPDTMLKGDQDEVWGFFHEMGHNHQNRDWTFSGSVEVTVNFFSLYNMELICGKKPRQTHKMRGERLKKKVEKWKADGRSFEEWKRDPFLALYFFMELQEKYGWDSFIKLFAEYRALPQSERPKTDADKRRQWCERYSRIVGKDLTEEFSFMLEKDGGK